MRPNLMSPKRERTSGEDSILAMLERDPARRRAAGGAAARWRLAWYGGSTLVALGLTATLVWLAAGNDGRRQDLERPVLADTGRAAPPPASPVVQVALAPDARTRSAAVIVDQRPDGVPPLRLLKPPATPAPKPLARPLPAPAPAAKPPAAVQPASAPRPRPPALARNAARPTPAKPPRPGAPVRAAEGAVDPDVALISAVIVHANGHAPEGSQMTELLCPNDSCRTPPNRQ